LTTWVVDASVAAKWCLPGEPLLVQATRVLKDYARGHALLLVPDLFWAELGNILWKAVRQGRVSADAATASFRIVRELALQTIPSEGLVAGALPIALTYGRTVYDCLYVNLAFSSKAQLITADERLANALAAYFPVKWLGAM
jgi:predicted nucleic acid-binding protein